MNAREHNLGSACATTASVTSPQPGRSHPATLRARLVEALGRDARGSQMLAERLRLAYANEPATIGASLLAAVLLAAALAPVVPAVVLATWLTVYAAALALRAITAAAYARTGQPGHRRWLRRLTLGMACSGATWSVAVFILLLPGDTVHLALLLFWIGGLATATVTAYAFVAETCLAFLATALLPPAMLLLFTGQGTAGATLGAGALLLLAFLVLMTVRAGRVQLRMLETELDNRRLIEALNAEKHQVTELNDLLRADLLEKQRAAHALRGARDRAEQLAERLAVLSARDGLTGIANRRHLDEALGREWARAMREGSSLALVMCDLDCFKAFNDHYGHQRGDECLQRIARVLDEGCRRGGDLAARYGGEEFVLLLPATDVDNATRIAEGLRRTIMALAVPHEASQVAAVATASFGVAALVPAPASRIEQLLACADRALYRAKAAGRNIVVADEPAAAG